LGYCRDNGSPHPISTANFNDGFVALKNGKIILLRIPYPMGYYAKGLDGRIDDPNAGWKGRGLRIFHRYLSAWARHRGHRLSLWGTGAVDLVSALSVVNVVMIGVGLAVAVRLGVRLHG